MAERDSRQWPPPYYPARENDTEDDTEDDSENDPDPDIQWRQALSEIQNMLKAYQDAKAKGDKNIIMVTEGLLVESLRRPAQIRPDCEEARQWEKRANDFAKADNEGKENILEGVGKGLLILIGAPIVTVGAVLFGLGKVLGGVGQLLTLGTVDKVKKLGK
jgi:hypothetical protein